MAGVGGDYRRGARGSIGVAWLGAAASRWVAGAFALLRASSTDVRQMIDTQ